MFPTITLQQTPTPPQVRRRTTFKVAGNLTPPRSPAANLRLPPRRFTVLSSVSSENVAGSSETSELTSSVGSPTLQWSFSQRHITVLNVAACGVAISATLLFCAAIPTLLAFKRAADSLAKLLDVTSEELPGTMAAVRLSGMEISDLTMELSGLGQEVTQGVRSSTRAVRVAEEKLRSVANLTSSAPMQVLTCAKTTVAEPALARSARGMREGIVKGRKVLQMILALTTLSRSIISYFSKRSNRRALNKYS